MHRRLLGVFALVIVVSVSFIAPAGAQQDGSAAYRPAHQRHGWRRGRRGTRS